MIIGLVAASVALITSLTTLVWKAGSFFGRVVTKGVSRWAGEILFKAMSVGRPM